jgi:hypothetical protein
MSLAQKEWDTFAAIMRDVSSAPPSEAIAPVEDRAEPACHFSGR